MEIKCPFCKSPHYTMGYFLYGTHNCKLWGEEAESQILKEYINLYTQLYGRNNK
jgi:hypothetical protein